MTVRAENVIDSPTLVSALTTASWLAWPCRMFSLTRKTRKRP